MTIIITDETDPSYFSVTPNQTNKRRGMTQTEAIEQAIEMVDASECAAGIKRYDLIPLFVWPDTVILTMWRQSIIARKMGLPLADPANTPDMQTNANDLDQISAQSTRPYVASHHLAPDAIHLVSIMHEHAFVSAERAAVQGRVRKSRPELIGHQLVGITRHLSTIEPPEPILNNLPQLRDAFYALRRKQRFQAR